MDTWKGGPKAAWKRWNALHGKEHNRKQKLRKKYGITQEIWNQQLECQKGCCALCLQPLPTDKTKIHTDHDHETGKFRGLLHRRCNLLIGWMESNRSLVGLALAYLYKHLSVLYNKK